MFSKPEFINSFVELLKAINEGEYQVLYNEFVDVCLPLQTFLQDISGDFKKALKELEIGLSKNSLDEFKLHEFSNLYWNYKQFM